MDERRIQCPVRGSISEIQCLRAWQDRFTGRDSDRCFRCPHGLRVERRLVANDPEEDAAYQGAIQIRKGDEMEHWTQWARKTLSRHVIEHRSSVSRIQHESGVQNLGTFIRNGRRLRQVSIDRLNAWFHDHGYSCPADGAEPDADAEEPPAAVLSSESADRVPSLDRVMRDMMTVQQAAESSGVAAPTLNAALKAGRLRGFKIGKRWIIHRAALADWQAMRDVRDGEWIPRERAEPPAGARVLVWRNNRPRIRTRLETGFWEDDQDGSTEHGKMITHWMPIPAPPE